MSDQRASVDEHLLPRLSKPDFPTVTSTKKFSKEHEKPIPYLEEIGPLIMFLLAVADSYLVRCHEINIGGLRLVLPRSLLSLFTHYSTIVRSLSNGGVWEQVGELLQGSSTTNFVQFLVLLVSGHCLNVELFLLQSSPATIVAEVVERRSGFR